MYPPVGTFQNELFYATGPRIYIGVSSNFVKNTKINNGEIIESRLWRNIMESDVRGHPYMTSALRGGRGVSPKEDVVREVA